MFYGDGARVVVRPTRTRQHKFSPCLPSPPTVVMRKHNNHLPVILFFPSRDGSMPLAFQFSDTVALSDPFADDLNNMVNWGQTPTSVPSHERVSTYEVSHLADCGTTWTTFVAIVGAQLSTGGDPSQYRRSYTSPSSIFTLLSFLVTLLWRGIYLQHCELHERPNVLSTGPDRDCRLSEINATLKSSLNTFCTPSHSRSGVFVHQARHKKVSTFFFASDVDSGPPSTLLEQCF